MNMEECVEALAKHANIMPIITSIGSFCLSVSSCFLMCPHQHTRTLTIGGNIKMVNYACSVDRVGEGEQGVLSELQSGEGTPQRLQMYNWTLILKAPMNPSCLKCVTIV